MYTLLITDLYPEASLRGVCLRSAPKLNKFKLFVPEGTGAVR